MVEGVGAARRETASLPDEQHWLDWMSEDVPFAAAERSWKRPGLIVCGSPGIACDPGAELAALV